MAMKTSKDRILTTHVGSMPRPEDLLVLLRAEDRGEPVEPLHLDRIVGGELVDFRLEIADLAERFAVAGEIGLVSGERETAHAGLGVADGHAQVLQGAQDLIAAVGPFPGAVDRVEAVPGQPAHGQERRHEHAEDEDVGALDEA